MLEKLNVYCNRCLRTTEHAVIYGQPVLLMCKDCGRMEKELKDE